MEKLREFPLQDGRNAARRRCAGESEEKFTSMPARNHALAALGSIKLAASLLFGRKGLRKRLDKIITLLEVGARVLFGFFEQTVFHHDENHLAKVLAGMDAPFLEHGQGHGAECFQRQFADAFEQFQNGDVVFLDRRAADGLVGFAFAAQHPPGVKQGAAQKKIGVPMIARVLAEDLLDDFFDRGCLHDFYDFARSMTVAGGCAVR